MNEKEIGVDKTLYEQQESKLSEQSAAFIELLTKRGILEDARIDDDRIRQAKKEKKKNMYHNTFLLLQHYRSILWTLECFPANVAEELDRPLQDLDTLLDRLDLELGLNNRKLESRMESIRRSRLLVDRLNEAVSILKTKPVNGHKMYDIIYMTFLGPDKLTHEELLYRLDISSTITGSAHRQSTSLRCVCGRLPPVRSIHGWKSSPYWRTGDIEHTRHDIWQRKRHTKWQGSRR